MAKEGGAGEREESIVWREEARRFETPDGEAFLQYRLAVQPSPSSCGGGATTAVMDMVHTYVPGSKRGQGLAARLCDAAFAHARRRGMRVVPTCSYISDTYLPRNPARNELVFMDDETQTQQQHVEEASTRSEVVLNCCSVPLLLYMYP